MNYLPVQSILTPGFLIIIGLIVSASLFFFYYMYKREKEFEEREGHIFKNYEQVIQEAHNKAKEIIDKASTEAATILTQSQGAKLNLDMKEGDAFKKIADEQIQLLHTDSEEYFRSYQKSLEEVKNHYTAQLEQMLTLIRESTEKEIEELKNVLKAQVTQSQGSFSQQMQDDFAKTQIEISEYKKHELEKVNQSINDLLVRILEEVLGKVIPVREHQQLILDSLESAKKEGMFNI